MVKVVTCACMAVVSCPKKRDVIRYWANEGKPIFERHGRAWCASVQRTSRVSNEAPNFIRLDR